MKLLEGIQGSVCWWYPTAHCYLRLCGRCFHHPFLVSVRVWMGKNRLKLNLSKLELLLIHQSSPLPIRVLPWWTSTISNGTGLWLVCPFGVIISSESEVWSHGQEELCPALAGVPVIAISGTRGPGYYNMFSSPPNQTLQCAVLGAALKSTWNPCSADFSLVASWFLGPI